MAVHAGNALNNGNAKGHPDDPPTMNRDYSQLFGSDSKTAPKAALSPLAALGWQTFFSAQTDTDEMAATPPVRVCEVHRNGAHVVGDDFRAWNYGVYGVEGKW